jgi:hypothetical protein
MAADGTVLCTCTAHGNSVTCEQAEVDCWLNNSCCQLVW